jgi:hypothetical protein
MTQTKPSSAPRKYLTWRYADRHYSKVHLLGTDAQPLCGSRPGREVGRPTPPIPDDAICPECLAREA